MSKGLSSLLSIAYLLCCAAHPASASEEEKGIISLKAEKIEISRLRELIKNPTVKVLDLEGCHIGDTGCEALGEVLTDNGALIKLNLSNNKISDEGLFHLVYALASHPSLTYLNLSSNNITSQGLSTLASGLSENSVLFHLSLKENPQIDSQGIREFIANLPSSSSLAADIMGKELKEDLLPFIAASQYALGMRYLKSQVEGADEEAASWFRQSAKKNNVDAYFCLGGLHEKGRGIQQSYLEALEWYKKASEGGHAESQYRLGLMYEEGRGVSQSDTEAKTWYEKAIGNNHREAQFKLGLIYEEGRAGVPFKTSKDWGEAFYKAKSYYQSAYEGKLEQVCADVERIDAKIRSSKAMGYFITKLESRKETKPGEVFFDPSHPFFEDIGFMVSITSKYAPRSRERLIDIAHYLLDCPEKDNEKIKNIMKAMKLFFSSHLFHQNAARLDVQDESIEGKKNRRPSIDLHLISDLHLQGSSEVDNKSEIFAWHAKNSYYRHGYGGIYDNITHFLDDYSFICLASTQKSLYKIFYKNLENRYKQDLDRKYKNADKVLEEWLNQFADAVENDGVYSKLLLEAGNLELVSDSQLISYETGYFYQKLKGYQGQAGKDTQVGSLPKAIPFGPHHPLFEKISQFGEELLSYASGVREMGISLCQRILDFPSESKLAQVLLDHLKELVVSGELQKKALPLDDLAINQAETLLRSLGEAVEATTQHNRLVSMNEVPEHVKIREFFIPDPRILLYNLLFREDENPFDQTKYQVSVTYILSLFKDGIHQEKITKEMCYNDEFKVQGDLLRLRDLLTKTKESQEDYGNIEVENRFANRMIKIADILRSGKLGDAVFPVLASWSAAGWHCDVRAEKETYEFYLRNIAEKKAYEFYFNNIAEDNRLPSADNTLEMEIAIILQNLRKELLQRLIPQDEKERIHQQHYVEKKLLGPLGLIGDIGKFEDGYEKSVLNKVYERMSVKTLKDYILKGSSGSDKYNYTTREKRSSRHTVPIKKGQAYTNPQILIDYVLKAVNDRENPPIDSDALLNRLSLYYGAKEASERIGEYYNIDEGKITQAGVKALLYSLGYLEGATAGSSKEVRS